MTITYVLDGAVLDVGQPAYAGLLDVTGRLVELVVGPDGEVAGERIHGADPNAVGGWRATFDAGQPGVYRFRWIVDGVDHDGAGGTFTVREPDPVDRPGSPAGPGAHILPDAGARIDG